eukprot:CFRG3952T1
MSLSRAVNAWRALVPHTQSRVISSGIIQLQSRLYTTNETDDVHESKDQSWALEIKEKRTFTSEEISEGLCEIVQNIVAVDSPNEWKNAEFTSPVMKARILRSCMKRFSISIPNPKLQTLHTINDTLLLLQALNAKPAKPPVFSSLELDNLPENLTIEV